MMEFASVPIEFRCPSCGFYNTVTLQEARLGAPIICRGCKNTLQTDDASGELAVAHRQIQQAFASLKQTLERMGN